MDGHPIPRQITTFEFKLIGFMTLRQFLYLLVSLPIAYLVTQIFPIPLINWLLGILIAVAGIVTAFMPIKDKTLDVWIKLFWKRLQQPTQFYYHKKNDPLYFLKDLYFLADPHHMLAHVESKEKLSQYLAMTKQRPRPNNQKKQVNSLLHTPSDVLQTSTAPVNAVNAIDPASPILPGSIPAPMPVPISPPTPVAVVTPPVFAPTHSAQYEPVVEPIVTAPTAAVAPSVQSSPASPALESAPVPEPVPVPVTAPPVPVAPSEPVVGSVPMSQPQMTVEVTPEPIPEPVVIPPTPTQPASANLPQTQPYIAPQTVSTIPQPTIIPPTEPFFAGVVKTAKRIPLPGVLIYVKDGQGSPVRILKTNPHGVFATYQPLMPGEYTFEIKDPNGTYFFDTMKHTIKEKNTEPFEFQSKELL